MGFTAYSIYKAIRGCGSASEIGLNAAGALIPCAAGAGTALRGADDLALGLTRSPTSGDQLLKPFADGIPARTWTDPAFADLVDLRQTGHSWESISEKIIDRIVANGGRLHFNLAELDRARGGVTVHELQYVLSNPTHSNATTFFNGVL